MGPWEEDPCPSSVCLLSFLKMDGFALRLSPELREWSFGGMGPIPRCSVKTCLGSWPTRVPIPHALSFCGWDCPNPYTWKSVPPPLYPDPSKSSVSRWRYRQVNALGGGHEDVSVIIGSLQHRCQIQCQILSLNWYSITYNTCISFCIFKLSADDSQYMDTIQMLHSFMPYHKYDIMTRRYLYVFKTCKSNMGEWCSSCTLERLRL